MGMKIESCYGLCYRTIQRMVARLTWSPEFGDEGSGCGVPAAGFPSSGSMTRPEPREEEDDEEEEQREEEREESN